MLEIIKKRVALYIRVSTEEQVQHWNWLEIQKEALLRFVSQSSIYTLNEKNIYTDEWKSWAYKENRPALQKLYEDAAQQEFDVVMVWKIDRFFRKTLFLLEWIEALDKLWIGFVSITQPFDTTNSFWKMMLWMMWVIAELERDLIKERTHSWIMKIMKDWKLWRWKPAYWFNKENGFLTEDSEERKAVELIFSMLVNEWMSLNSIWTKLSDLGIKTASEGNKLSEKQKNIRKQDSWSRKVLYNIVRNEMYMWKLIQNRYIYNKKTKKKDLRPENEWIITECPAFISEETFEKAQKQLETNRTYSKRNTWEWETYMLSTLLQCWETWYKYIWYKSSKWTKNYRLCVDKSKLWYSINQRSISATELEKSVWEKLAGIIKNPGSIKYELEKIINSNSDSETTIKIDLIKDSIARIKSNNKGLLWIINDFNQEEIKNKLIENTQKLEKLEKDRMNLEWQLLSEEQKEKQLKDLVSLSEWLSDFIDELSYEAKTFICRKLIEKVVLDWEDVKITLLVPIKTENMKSSPRESRLDIVKNLFDEQKSFIWAKVSTTFTELKNTISGFSGDSVNLCYYIGGLS